MAITGRHANAANALGHWLAAAPSARHAALQGRCCIGGAQIKGIRGPVLRPV
jgi:hypothetical protein